MVEATKFPGQKTWVGRMPRVGPLQVFSNHAGTVELVRPMSQLGLGRAFECVESYIVVVDCSSGYAVE